MTANDTISVATNAGVPQSLYDMVGEVAAAYCRKHFPEMRAALMIGSMGRGEATWERTADGWRVAGDAEFVLVFDDEKVPKVGAAGEFCSFVASGLKTSGIDCSIDVSVVGSRWLSKLPKSIFSYEVRNASRVIYGSASVLDDIPLFASSDISTDDAWRLVCNRLVEWLEVPERGDKQMYRSVKLVLDTATALLVYHGAFVPTYEARYTELQNNSETSPSTWPFSQAEFIALVDECTRFKLGRGAQPSKAALGKAPEYAMLLVDLLSKCRTPDRALTYRVRGWAVVARESGLLLTLQNCVRWLLLSKRGTPRELVYSAALRVLRLRTSGLGDEGRLQSIRATLPRTERKSSPGMEGLFREIAWNYHKFIERTRA